MTIDINMDTVAKWFYPNKKEAELTESKRNLVVKGFNASTALLIAAVAAAIFFNSFVVFVYCGVAGLILRTITEEELQKYTTINKAIFFGRVFWRTV